MTSRAIANQKNAMKTEIKAAPAEAIASITALAGESEESIEVCRYSLATPSGTVAANLYCHWDAGTESPIWDLGIESNCHEADFEAAERDIRAHAMDLTSARDWRDAEYMTCSKRSSAYMLLP